MKKLRQNQRLKGKLGGLLGDSPKEFWLYCPTCLWLLEKCSLLLPLRLLGKPRNTISQQHPEENPVLRFFTWRWVLTLGFGHMYSSPVFLGALVLLGTSLMACTYTTQIPLVKVARRWSFMQSANSIKSRNFPIPFLERQLKI